MKVEDANGRKVVFDNPGREEFLRIRIDGCLVNDGKKVDFVLEKGGNSILIEMKGKGVEKALAQAVETAKFWRQRRPDANISGLIVCRGCPSTVATTVQAKKAQFKKACAGPIHIISGERVLVFDNVFRAVGIEAR